MALQPYNASVYNEQALASAALMRQGVIGNLAELKKNLPHVDSVIEIGVTTQEDAQTVHRVATLRLNYSPVLQGKLGLDISVHKYGELSPQLLGYVQTPQNLSSDALVPSGGQVTLAPPQWVQVITVDDMKNFRGVDGETRAPNSLKILDLLRATFPKGLPLPAQASILKYHFKIVVCVPKSLGNPEKYERLESEHRGDHVNHTRAISNLTEEGEGATQYSYSQLTREFEHMGAVAAGRALPSSVPEGVFITSVAGSYQLKDAPLKRKIEES